MNVAVRGLDVDGVRPYLFILSPKGGVSPREAQAGAAGKEAWQARMVAVGDAVRQLRCRGFAGGFFGSRLRMTGFWMRLKSFLAVLAGLATSCRQAYPGTSAVV